MNEYPESRDEESPVISGPAPENETENQLIPASLVATLTKAEIEQQLSAAHAFPRSPAHARDMMVSLATMDEQTAAECVYSVPRGGRQIRGPSIRFAEIVLSCWGNIRCAARVTIEDRIERFVEAEALVHDLQTNVGFVARARRRIELKKGRKFVDPDMIQLAGAAATSVARRNAILGCVPKPVWRKALEAVESVIKGDQKTLAERRDSAVGYFNKMGVPTERILAALEVKHVDDITLDHLLDLNGMRAALKTSEATLDQLFPEPRPEGPKPETLDDKLKALATVDPETGEISMAETALQQAATTGTAFVKDGRVLRDEEVRAPAAPKAQRGPRSARKPSPEERVRAEGDAAAAKGAEAFRVWEEGLTSDDVANISPAMDAHWHEMLKA